MSGQEEGQGARVGEPGAIWLPSPNAGARRGGARPRLVVLHYTAMETAAAALERLCDPTFAVSAHYLVGRDGRLWQLVCERARAWHAGAGAWGAVRDVNSASIGIEIDNSGRAPFAEPAMARLEALLAGVMARWRIGPESVIGHSDCAPGRKADPGPRFDWRRLALRGLALRPDTDAEPGLDPSSDVGALLARAGWTAEAPLEARLAAFRARFRPGGEGPADAADRALLAALPEGPGIDTVTRGVMDRPTDGPTDGRMDGAIDGETARS
ncbi:N-acetylmuramoyl-L-alanine amidase [Rhodovulum sp. 12E13]|uniref:N-acetylmuramoyl-L-alanine amidase n=1 Tax=Rhodovulum sp. 12E13 TaxID=2203891 RepID=UPI0035132D69